MTNRAVQVYDDNPEMIKLKSDINDIQNWKVVRESFRQFDAERPGPGIIVRNRDTEMYYRTTEEYPWLIHGIGDEIYVDSDDLKLEDLTGHPIKFSRGSTIPSNPGYITVRVAGAKHQDSLKGSSAVDLQNCRQFYAFYLNPNKYDAKALNEFTLTVNNEFSRGSVCNGEVTKQVYGLGNFLICRTYGEMHKPDFTTIDLIPGDVFIQRFNAKPFKLKKIDEVIDRYNRDELMGNRHVSMPKQEIAIITENDKLLESRRNTESKLEEKEDFLRKLSDELFNAQVKSFLCEVPEQSSNFKEQRRNTSGKNYRLIVRPNGYDITKQKYLCATGRDIPEELRNKYKQIDMYTMFKCQNDLVAFKLVEIVIARQFNDLDRDNKLSVKSILTLKNKKTGKKKILSFVENYSGQKAVKNMVMTQYNNINKGFKWMDKKLSDMEA